MSTVCISYTSSLDDYDDRNNVFLFCFFYSYMASRRRGITIMTIVAMCFVLLFTPVWHPVKRLRLVPPPGALRDDLDEM